MMAFCFVRNAATTSRPTTIPPTQVLARIATTTTPRSRASSSESTRAVSAHAPATRYVAAYNPAASNPTATLPVRRCTTTPTSASTIRLAANDTTRIVGRLSPSTSAAAEVTQKYIGGYGQGVNCADGGPYRASPSTSRPVTSTVLPSKKDSS